MSQEARTFKVGGGYLKIDYLLHLPPGYDADPDRRWPMILFLHGAGERGTDVEQVKKHGIARLVEEQPDFPFVTVSPQCPPNVWWGEIAFRLMAHVAEFIDTHRVDASRVYLTGLSMGGFGTWLIGSEWPERFAALAPICGGGNEVDGFPERVRRLVSTPVWAFHGADDTVVPLSASQALVSRLQAEGGDVRLTVYPDCGHDSWTQTYANPALYEWFLSHSFSQR